MKLDQAAQRLLAAWAEISDLSAVAEVLRWDQETMMPPQGLGARAAALATLAGLRHAKLADPALLEAVTTCREEAAEGSELAAQASRAWRDLVRASHLPERLMRELAEVEATGMATWQEARQKADFALYRPALEHMIRLKREQAAALAPLLAADGTLYDALLDEFEPGAREAELAPLFAELRRELAPLVRGVIDAGAPVDESVVEGVYPVERQLAFGRELATAIGFDFEAGRIDHSTHPFCTAFGPGDVRLTWRWEEGDFRPGLFGILHETGHGLYEQGLPAAWQRTPLGPAVSLGVHESQSRLWENLVGRSRGFWHFALPRLHHHLPASAGLTVETLWPALHTVRPSLIRVEADEATYNLHVAVRFDLERRLFAGELEAGDLPAAWDEAYEQALGIRPPNAALGVLQDVHWSLGAFGYFPTYTLGTLAASQLFAAAGEALGDLEAAFSRGEFLPLLGWLRDHVHTHGSRFETSELLLEATGAKLSTQPFLSYLRQTVRDVYGV